MTEDVSSQFETVRDQYDNAYRRFVSFRWSSMGKKYKEALDYFLHETNKYAANLGNCLLTGDLPEPGRASVLWMYYHQTLANIGLMNLILELWNNEKGEA